MRHVRPASATSTPAGAAFVGGSGIGAVPRRQLQVRAMVVQVGIFVPHFRGAVVDEGDVVDVGRRHSGDGQGRHVSLNVRRRQTGNAFLVDRRRRRRALNQLRGGRAARRQGRRGRVRRPVWSADERNISTGSGVRRGRNDGAY